MVCEQKIRDAKTVCAVLKAKLIEERGL